MSEDAIWLDVLPSMAGFGDKLAKDADKEADKAGKGAGKKFGLAMAAGVTAVAGGVVLAGKALYDLGATFDDMADTIRVGTGATGENLDALVASAKNVGNTVPAAFGDIGTVVADVNTRLGLTGTTLETFSGQVLEAGRLTGEAIDVNKISAAFSVFKVEGEASVGAMDTLYRVSQDTGVGMNDLAAIVQKAGPAVQALGFDFDQTAALVGGLDKAGLDASKMTAGLSRSLVELAKDGEEPQEAFKRVTGEIESMAKAGDVAGATDMAAKLFGTKNAPQFVQALKDGALNLENLTTAATGSGDTIMAASEDTADFAEQWQLFQNKMSVLVAPAAEKVFGIIGTGMAWITDNAVPAIQDFMAQWEAGTGPLGEVKDVLATVEAFIRDKILPVLSDVGAFIVDKVVPYVAQLVAIVIDNVIPMAQGWWAVFQEKVLPVLQDVAAFIMDKVVPAVQDFLEKATPAFQNIATLVQEVFTGVVLPILGVLWDFIRNVLGPIFSWLWDTIVSPILSNMGTGFKVFSDVALGVFRGVRDFIKDVLGPAFRTFGDGVADVWEGLQRAIAVPVNFIINTIWNDGLRKALNLIPGVNLGRATPVSVPSSSSRGSTGGATTARAFYAGGFTGPGNWWDPAGVVHAGEYVFTKDEVDRMGGWQALEAWKHALPGYATGGLVTWRGKTFTDRFAANLAAAEATSGARFNISQGGFRPRTSYSGTSHQADAVDIMGPITTLVITALRKHGVAAWDRTGKGNWAPHIHGVPLPGYGTAGGSAIWQAQDYLRGGDGLGGRDNGPRVSADGTGGLFAIPGMIADVMKSVATGLTGPWGAIMADGMGGLVEGVKDWALGKLNGWATDLGTMLFGAKPARGYAGGTTNAQPGWAMLGETAPELVMGPQARYMHGGESVLSGSETRAFLGGRGGAGQYVTAEDIAEALVLVGFPERVRDGVAKGLSDRGRGLLVEAMEG